MAPPCAALNDVLVMITPGGEHCSEVSLGTRFFPLEARIIVPLIAAEIVGLQPRHAIGQRARGIVEDHFAPKRLTLHMCEPRNAVSGAGHRDAMLLLNAVDAAIDALA